MEPLDGVDRVTIAAFLDTERLPWAGELINFTVELINSGWQGNILGGTRLDYTLSDSACDRNVAVRAFLNITRDGVLPHAILGCRCSSPTMAISTLAAAENIPVLSPAASASQLSNRNNYPTFNRLVGPDNQAGQVGALIQLLRTFGWERINIINTNTEYAQALKVELIRAWRGKQDGYTGEIGYEGTVQVDQDTDEVDPESVKDVLGDAPVNNPSIHSKVVVLVAHHQHAYPILRIAQESGFDPNTIYIGVDSWTGRAPSDRDTSWMRDIPGYIGLVPYRNLDGPFYKEFLGKLQAEQQREGRTVMANLPDSAADRTVDSVLALAKALSMVSQAQRHDGTAVIEALRSLKFEGVSGTVEFDEKGDWANPKYTVMALPERGTDFKIIGTASPDSADIDLSQVCYANLGCGVPPPSEKYPVPSDAWQVIVLVVLGVMLAILLPLAYRLYIQRLPLKRRLKMVEERIKEIDSNDGEIRKKKGSLYKEIARLLNQPRPLEWTDDHGLVSIPPAEKEYWDVLQKMRATTVEQVWITQLSRVQNDGVWSHYVFRKSQIASKYGLDVNDTDALCEQEAWHGTSSLNPDVITNDKNYDGFMMQYSQQGLYGRGLYFADRFDYSDCYSHRVNNYNAFFPHGSVRQDGEDREIFLVKLLIGKAIEMNHQENEEQCRNLVAAPYNPDTEGLRYDTVSGMAADDTKIHTVYENGRAYPTYLIRYYKGPRDPSRTPFASYEQHVKNQSMDMTCATDSSESQSSDELPDRSRWSLRNVMGSLRRSSSVGEPTVVIAENFPTIEDDEEEEDETNNPPADVESGALQPVWMYEGDDGKLVPYGSKLQPELESAYQRDRNSNFTIPSVADKPWTYSVDFRSMVQTNTEHPAHRQRKISRIVV